MDDRYIEVYSIMYDVIWLSNDEYNDLVFKYGKDIVDLVIADIIDEDENNVSRFEIYCSVDSDNSDKVGYFSSSTSYKHEVNGVPCLNNE